MRSVKHVPFESKTPFDVTIIPVLDDNYSFIITERSSRKALVVDPVEPEKVIKAVGKDVVLVGILTTHCHADHAGGNEELVSKYPGIKVYGHDNRTPALTDVLRHEARIELGDGGLSIEALHNPCHTSESTSYVVHDQHAAPSALAVFTGDTLFLAGCGRFFEGDASQMHSALYKIIGTLPRSVLVFPGHEYTLANLLFARHLEPENAEVKRWIGELTMAKQKGDACSLPGILEREFKANPFMRLSESAVANAAKETDPVRVMAALREMKNKFKA